MKRSFLGAGVVLAAAFVIQPAVAADLGTRIYKTPIEAPPTWTGFYVGAGIGGAAGTYDLAGGTYPGYGDVSAELNGLGAQGFLFGLDAGFDYQFSQQFVIGAFVDYDWHNEDVKASASASYIDWEGEEARRRTASGQAKTDVNGQWSVGVRLGYLSSPATLWYLSAGYTNLSIDDLEASGTLGFGNGTFVVGIPDFDGWFVGVGAESKLTNNISLKAEYRYSSFDTKDLSLPSINGFNLNDAVYATLEPTVQTFKLSVNYRFNSW